MEAFIWITAGLVAGWLAGLLVRGRDTGVFGNILVGTIGGVVGGWAVRLAGYAAPDDWLRHTLVSLFGAMLLLGLARRLRTMARRARAMLRDTPAAGAMAQLERLGDFERRVLDRLRGHSPRTRNVNELLEQRMTVGEMVADRVATFGGSWTFIGVFLLFMLLWMAWNTEGGRRFDPYPFILLNLILSCLAALQAPVIMMSQNRQAAKDRLEAKNDYEVNTRAESEITRLHAKFDEMREREWTDLVEMQRRQIALLEDALRRLGTRGG